MKLKPAEERMLRKFRRPIILAIAASVGVELVIFVVFGMILHPQGNLLHKFFWTVVFCGVGMASTVGALISLIVLGRWNGWKAILATTSVLVLGLGCTFLCFSLDRHFHYFGGEDNPVVFWSFGVVVSAIGGLAVGWLLFSDRQKIGQSNLRGKLPFFREGKDGKRRSNN